MEHNKANRKANVIGILIVIFGTVAAFMLFYHSNVQRIGRQNENYIADTATHRAASLDNLFLESQDFIESTAVVIETEFKNRGIDPALLNVEEESEIPVSVLNEIRNILLIYEERFGFDYLRFIDLHGRDYTTHEQVIKAIVLEREYYQKGVLGQSGITYVLDSKVTTERQIGFYAPVYMNGEIIGVAVGFYGEDYIHRLLDMSLFDYPCDVLLCDGDGTVIFDTSGQYAFQDFDEAMRNGTISEAGMDLSRHENQALRLREDGKDTVGYIACVGELTGYYLVAKFPANVHHSMIHNANNNGVVLLTSLSLLFLCAAVFYIVRYMAQRKKMMQQAEDTIEEAGNMITALASDYWSAYYLDLEKDEAICYQESGEEGDFRTGQHFQYTESITAYAHQYVTDEYRDEFLAFVSPASLREKLQKNKVISHRYLIRKSGKELYVQIRFARVCNLKEGGENCTGAVGLSFSNVDEETRREMERTRALKEALATAEEANKAKTAFLSNMSHEIRTPMNAIIGLDNIALNDTTISPQTREHLEKIGTSARHLLGIINDILDMSRIESGRMVVKHEEFSFQKGLEQVNTIISGQCKDKGLHYECRTKGQIDEYYIGDDMKLRQVMLNILGNAVKFTPSGGTVSFLIEDIARMDDKATLRFTIRDTGIGMSKEYLPRLFEAFSQEDSSNTSKYGSTGLGMPITKSIVELMNGQIHVESEKGVGTTFTVTVTLTRADRKTIDDEELQLRPHEMSVLVIDDDRIACEHAEVTLGQVGISCETVLTGKEAVEMVRVRHARREDYNLILVDWKMPEMDGLETTRQIRAIVGSDTPIIILTSYSWEDIEEEAREAGVDTFAAKPLFAGTVMDEFRAAFRKKNAHLIRKTADLKGRRVLLAEDVMVNAEIMMMVLSMREMQADHAENGRIAVEMFESHAVGYYDAILIDMRMPEMDGLEATKAIRALNRADANTIPIIALTANAFDEDVQRSMQAGLNAHLSKPVEPELLFETLEGLIHG